MVKALDIDLPEPTGLIRQPAAAGSPVTSPLGWSGPSTPGAASEEDWYANVVCSTGGKCLLLMHAGTLFPTPVSDVRVPVSATSAPSAPTGPSHTRAAAGSAVLLANQPQQPPIALKTRPPCCLIGSAAP